MPTLSARARLAVAIVVILAEGFSAVVATTAFDRGVSLFVVVLGAFMAVDALFRMRAQRD